MKLVSFFEYRENLGWGILKHAENFSLISKVGNSGYGKTITNQLKHRNVEYCSDAEVTQKVNTPLFRKLNNIAEDTYKVESC